MLLKYEIFINILVYVIKSIFNNKNIYKTVNKSF